MKIWIGTDMEGIAGVVDREHTHREGREHDPFLLLVRETAGDARSARQPRWALILIATEGPPEPISARRSGSPSPPFRQI